MKYMDDDTFKVIIFHLVSFRKNIVIGVTVNLRRYNTITGISIWLFIVDDNFRIPSKPKVRWSLPFVILLLHTDLLIDV